LLLVSHDRAFLDNVVTSLLVLEGDGHVQEFVGGYADWARWRDERDAARAATAAATRRVATTESRPPAGAAPARRKLSYKEQRELAELPARLEDLETRKAQLASQTGDPAFYSRPHAEVADSLAALARLDEEIEATFSRWAELEER
jgi:ATP-binding cassette subfamily F protein uup